MSKETRTTTPPKQTTTPSHVWQAEILVVGAGPGGSAAAWALARLGHDVLLVDRASFPRRQDVRRWFDAKRGAHAA